MGRLLNLNVSRQPLPAAARVPAGNLRPVSASFRSRAAVPLSQAAIPAADSAEQDFFRKLAFRAGVAMLFVRIAVIPDLLAAWLHTNTYLLYIVGPPAMIGALVTGGVGRTLRHRASWMWLGMLLCMLLSVPFSSWPGDSTNDFRLYLLFCFPLLFTVAGLTVTFREVQSTFYALGTAGIVVIVAARFLATGDTGRIDMSNATANIGNSNDLASHLILVLPFVLFIAMDRRRSILIRCSMILPAGYALWLIVGTASRGAVVALAAAFLFVLFRASAKQRLAALVVAVALTISVPIFLKGNTAERLSTLFGGQHEEAAESEAARSYLLKQSVIYTFQHPILGVGLGQFSNYEGMRSREEGKHGNWHETHNAFTEVSSECGIPALIFFVLGIGSAMMSVSRIYRRSRKEGYPEITNACFCYLLSMVGFLVSIVFLANAFRFYLPLMVGLAIALSAAAEREMGGSRVEEPVRIIGRVGPIPARPRMAQS